MCSVMSRYSSMLPLPVYQDKRHGRNVTLIPQPAPAPPGHHGHPGHRPPCTHWSHRAMLRANGQLTRSIVSTNRGDTADGGLQDCRTVSPLYKQLLQAAAAYQAATTVLQRCTSSSLSSREESCKYFLVKLNIFIATARF